MQASSRPIRPKRLSLTSTQVVEMIEQRGSPDAGSMDHASEPITLASEWAFWHDSQRKKGLKREAFEAEIKQGTPFSTISEFWIRWNDIQDSMSLPLRNNVNVNVFKRGIKPLWEDPANRRGGKFQVSLAKNIDAAELNEAWLYVVISVLLGEMGVQEEINGMVLSTRNWGNTLSIWTRSTEAPELEIIAQKLSQIFDQEVKFQRHKNSLKKNRVLRANQRKETSVSPKRSDDESSDLQRSSSGESDLLEEVEAIEVKPVQHTNSVGTLSIKEYLLLHSAHLNGDVRDAPSKGVSCH